MSSDRTRWLRFFGVFYLLLGTFALVYAMAKGVLVVFGHAHQPPGKGLGYLALGGIQFLVFYGMSELCKSQVELREAAAASQKKSEPHPSADL